MKIRTRVLMFTVSLIAAIGPSEGQGEGFDVPGQKGMSIPELEAIEETDILPGKAGTVYSALPVAYHEVSFNWFLDARKAADSQGWTCPGLPVLDPGLPLPGERCFITPPPDNINCGTDEVPMPIDVTRDSIASRYVFNNATPVLVERPSGERFIAYYIQFNNWTGSQVQGRTWPCPWHNLSGPSSWILNGGDEFIVFRSPATPDGARGVGLTLENDHLRPDDGWLWQFKSAIFEADRGPDGRVTLFAKRTDEGNAHGGDGIQINHIVFKRTDDPFNFDVGTWESAFWNCQQPCTDPTCTPQEQAECDTAHGYRMTDIALVDEKTTEEWDYVGVLSWLRDVDANTVQAGAAAVRIKSRAYSDVKDNSGQWVRVPWGGEIDFPLERTVQGRIAGLFEVIGADGRKHHELWRIRADVARGGKTPCAVVAGGDDSAYEHNLNFYRDSDGDLVFDSEPAGLYADFFYFDPDPERLGAIPGGPFVFDSLSARDWQTPTDYNAGYTWVLGRLQLEEGVGLSDFFYMGSRDPLICTFPLDPLDWRERGTGKGVAVAEIVRSCVGIFCDGFESGNTLAWSGLLP